MTERTSEHTAPTSSQGDVDDLIFQADANWLASDR